MIILLMGAPGSGKSTQGSALMKINTKLVHLSLGEVVRDILAHPQHPITCKYQTLISRGELLPDDVILDVLRQTLEEVQDKEAIILLDGYPRTEAQYEQFKQSFGVPSGLIHLDIEASVTRERLHSRHSSRTDDHDGAIARRLEFYRNTTQPLVARLQEEFKDRTITAGVNDSIQATSIYLYSKLQRIATIHDVLKRTIVEKPRIDFEGPSPIEPIWTTSMMATLWRSGNAYKAIDRIQNTYHLRNFSFNALGKTVVYLETAPEVKAILDAPSHLGYVYRHFSAAAGLKFDFVALDTYGTKNYKKPDGTVNVWSLIHTALSRTLKSEQKRIERVMDKHLNQTFFAEKSFDLDSTFDLFFCAFWSEYLFGNQVQTTSYMQNRTLLLSAMKQCFYSNHYKGLDPTGLSSWMYSYAVRDPLARAKETIKDFIKISTTDSLVQRFKQSLILINDQENLALDDQQIEGIVADNAFDLFFEPDFLESVMYEALVAVIRDNANLHEAPERRNAYAQGMQKGYLFPVRSRILEEPLVLPGGLTLPSGSLIYMNLKRAGIYHSAGDRRCVGIAFTSYFKEHFFNRLESIEFKVKAVTQPADRLAQSGDDNVPVSPERYHVSWRLKRDEAMRYLPFHDYKGQKFFDVLALHRDVGLDAHMVNQLKLKIKKHVQKNSIDLSDVVIATVEVRGIPIATNVANHLQLPLYIIRKKGHYKMALTDVCLQEYNKGYGEPDAVELPIEIIKLLAGKKIFFIDDGLASGHSALACVALLETKLDDVLVPAQVQMVLCMLQHDYTQVDPRLSEHRLVKSLFDCRSTHQPEEVARHPEP